jgi:GNAT superfamily N-acetyltransferase
MEIIPYAQFEGRHQMLPLFHHAGHNPFDYRLRARPGSLDFRIIKGHEGLCGVEDGELLGFVGLMDIPTRRGVSKALMEASHEYFHERGFRFSFLTTYGSWGAHRLYRKLGYEDVKPVTGCSSAYLLVESDSEADGHPDGSLTPTEESVADLFEQFTSQFTGFVVRPKEYLGYVARRGGISWDRSLEMEGGYVLARERSRCIQVREMVAMDSAVQERLLDALEHKADNGSVLDSLVTTPTLQDGYVSRGYHLYAGRYGVLMAKQLGDVSMNEVYGDRFYISAMEWF